MPPTDFKAILDNLELELQKKKKKKVLMDPEHLVCANVLKTC